MGKKKWTETAEESKNCRLRQVETYAIAFTPDHVEL